MKLIVQIPCFNEEQALPKTLSGLPRSVPGFERVEWLVIDDGSTDRTAETALAHGADHVVRMHGNKGLARAFMAGVMAALERGADVIVNTDADNQYDARDIPALVQPILDGKADLVIGARPIASIRHFSPSKRALQSLGSWIVRAISGTNVQDAPSGFRAFSRDTALRLNVFNNYTYTLETIIQAGINNLRIVNVPVRVNQPMRPSRLVKSIPSYILRSIIGLVGVYLVYKPFRIFSLLSAVFLAPGFYLAARYLALHLGGHGAGHVQSVIAAAVLAICGVFMLAIGITAQLLAINRRLLEDIQAHHRRNRIEKRAAELNSR